MEIFTFYQVYCNFTLLVILVRNPTGRVVNLTLPKGRLCQAFAAPSTGFVKLWHQKTEAKKPLCSFIFLSGTWDLGSKLPSRFRGKHTSHRPR